MFRAGLLINAFALAVVVGGVTPAQAPRIEASADGWNFGVRDQGEKDKKIVEIRNAGARPLVIRKVQTTCGCVAPSMEIKTILGGESADLVLDLDTNKGEGEIKKFIILETNDPIMPKLSLEMTGTINPIWKLSTFNLNFGKCKNGAQAKKTIRVLVRKGWKVGLESVVAFPKEKFALEPKPFKNEDGSYGWDVVITLQDKIENGFFEGAVFVTTDYKDYARRGARIMGEIESTTSWSPRRLALGRLEAGKAKTVKVTVHKQQGQGLGIIEVLCKDPQVSSKVIEKEPGKLYEIEITFTPAADSKAIRGTVEINCDEPGFLVLPVEFSGRVVAAKTP